jgi:putative sterol carrier protein
VTAPEAMYHQLRSLAHSTTAAASHPPQPDEVEALLDLVFEWFRVRFSPARAGLASGVFHYEIDTPLGARHRYVVVHQGVCTTPRTLGGTPDATIGVALADLVALAAGELRGTEAFVGGRLKISGDAFFAMNWIEWFGARSVRHLPPAGRQW